jgi:thioesterase domain-containing protein
LAADAGCAVDVLAVKGDIDYRLPIRQDALFVARADVDLLALFGERLARRGKARMRVQVEARVDDAVCARFSGDYLAQVMATNPVLA